MIGKERNRVPRVAAYFYSFLPPRGLCFFWEPGVLLVFGWVGGLIACEAALYN